MVARRTAIPRRAVMSSALICTARSCRRWRRSSQSETSARRRTARATGHALTTPERCRHIVRAPRGGVVQTARPTVRIWSAAHHHPCYCHWPSARCRSQSRPQSAAELLGVSKVMMGRRPQRYWAWRCCSRRRSNAEASHAHHTRRGSCAHTTKHTMAALRAASARSARTTQT